MGAGASNKPVTPSSASHSEVIQVHGQGVVGRNVRAAASLTLLVLSSLSSSLVPLRASLTLAAKYGIVINHFANINAGTGIGGFPTDTPTMGRVGAENSGRLLVYVCTTGKRAGLAFLRGAAETLLHVPPGCAGYATNKSSASHSKVIRFGSGGASCRHPTLSPRRSTVHQLHQQRQLRLGCIVWPIFDEEEGRKGRHCPTCPHARRLPLRPQPGQPPLDWRSRHSPGTGDRAVWPGRPHTEVK